MGVGERGRGCRGWCDPAPAVRCPSLVCITHPVLPIPLPPLSLWLLTPPLLLTPLLPPIPPPLLLPTPPHIPLLPLILFSLLLSPLLFLVPPHSCPLGCACPRYLVALVWLSPML